MDKQAQRTLLLTYMEHGGKVSRMQAMRTFNIADPIKRISELRDLGVKISDRWVYKLNAQGKVEKKYKEYFMEGKG